jgi:hypothetical protein
MPKALFDLVRNGIGAAYSTGIFEESKKRTTP